MRPEDVAYSVYKENPCDATQDALYKAIYTQAKTVIYLLMHKERDDLAANAATKAVLNLDSFKEDSAFSTWTHRIIRNTITDTLRQIKQRGETSFEDMAAEHIPLDTGLDGYAAILLEDVKKSCGAVDRIILEGKLFGLSEEELAEVTELTEAGVRNRWSRLKERVMLLLKRS